MGPQESTSRWAAEQAAKTLDALRWNWGDAYLIDHIDGRWTADRLDGRGRTLKAANPDKLRKLIFDDYTAKPVPRDLPARED